MGEKVLEAGKLARRALERGIQVRDDGDLDREGRRGLIFKNSECVGVSGFVGYGTKMKEREE